MSHGKASSSNHKFWVNLNNTNFFFLSFFYTQVFLFFAFFLSMQFLPSFFQLNSAIFLFYDSLFLLELQLFCALSYFYDAWKNVSVFAIFSRFLSLIISVGASTQPLIRNTFLFFSLPLSCSRELPIRLSFQLSLLFSFTQKFSLYSLPFLPFPMIAFRKNSWRISRKNKKKEKKL